MNFKSISYYLGLFCFPVSVLAFINILYSSYFDYFLSINSYITVLIVSLVIGLSLLFFGKRAEKKIHFIEQLLLIILVYLLISLLVALPFYLSNSFLYFARRVPTLIRPASFNFFSASSRHFHTSDIKLSISSRLITNGGDIIILSYT